MGSSSGSLDTCANSYQSSFSFLSHNNLMTTTSFSDLLASSPTDDHQSIKSSTGGGGLGDRIAERTGSGVPKFKSLPPPSLPLSPPSVSPSSYFAIPPGLSPAELLDSPVLLNTSHIFPSPTTGSFANWKITSSQNNQQNVKQEDQNYSDFSFQTQTRPPPSTATSTMFQSSNSSIHTAQQRWNFQESAKQDNFSAIQTNNTNYNGFQSDYGDQQQQYQSVREQRRSEDGYNWRKYGQKQVKGSENPRSYYKCTYPNCPTKKKVERSLDGQITEIVYKGSHNHPKPQSNRRSSTASTANNQNAIQPANHDNGQDHSFGNRVSGCGGGQIDPVVTTPDNSSISLGDDDFDSSQKSKSRSDEFDEDEPEGKRLKTEGENEGISAAGSRTVREPRVVVQTTSDIDILDDGYRWRKYGQKVVKGNPNPRSYYKCTHPACPVRKHVERASHDIRAVITTYEGKHNHDVPAARGSHCAVNRPLPDNNTHAAMATIRPSAVNPPPHSNNHHHNHPVFNRRLPPSSDGESPFSLDTFQSPGSFGFSGLGSFMNQTKEEPREHELFLESLLC